MRALSALVVLFVVAGCDCGAVNPVVDDSGVTGGGGGTSTGGGSGGGGGSTGGGGGGGATGGGGGDGGMPLDGGATRQTFQVLSGSARLQSGSVTLDVQVGVPASPRRATAGSTSFELESTLSR